jgi:toxin ParE1/3/4
MARYRLSEPAKADIASILRTSETRHGPEARARYRGLLTAALRRLAADPHGPSTMDRSEILAGVRSFHIRHCRGESREAPVAAPVHVIFYRAAEPGLVEIVRVLHERMERRHHVLREAAEPEKPTDRNR